MADCFLLGTESKLEFQFVAIKENRISYSVQYDTIPLLKSVVQPVDYQRTTGLERSFTVGMPAILYTEPVKDILDRLRSLCKPIKGSYEPEVIVFQWLDEIFSPCIINGNIDIRIISTIGNTIKNAEVSLTLLQIPENSIV